MVESKILNSAVVRQESAVNLPLGIIFVFKQDIEAKNKAKTTQEQLKTMLMSWSG